MFVKGSGGGRARFHHSGGQRKQQDSNFPSGRKFREGVRVLGVHGRRVQGHGGSGGDDQRQHPGVRQGEPQGADLLGQQ